MSMINFCRAGLDAMVGNPETGVLDYLFCNEEEAQTWCNSTDLAQICQQLRGQARVVCLTRSAKGSLVLEGDQVTEVPSAKVVAVDTNGAGDMFAGAFLYAVTHGHSHAHAAWLANQCAGQVVAQVGNRLSQGSMDQLKALFAKHLGP
jgi:sugar/nucleoside kinase (ribokinase family)